MKTNHSCLTEIQMMEAIIIKDKKGLSELYNRHADKLYGHICHAIKEEILQQRALARTIIIIGDTASEYDKNVERPLIWMLKITQKSIAEVLSESSIVPDFDNFDFFADSELLDVLDKDKLIVFTGVYHLGIKIDDIAEMLNIKTTEAQKLLHSAIKEVKNFYMKRNN